MSSYQKGVHLILDLYDCDPAILNDKSKLRLILSNAAIASKSTILNVYFHQFEPIGVTGSVIISESHINIHTWPELSYAAVDIFTCGDHSMPEKAADVIIKGIKSQRPKRKVLNRNIEKA